MHGTTIEIPDVSFEKIFGFFEEYDWHLDDRPTRKGNEINPDVLGYVFEKYINQKDMGAYYSKEDITEYIGKNTIIPAIFSITQKSYKQAFEGEQSVWRLLRPDPDRYIQAALLHGMEKRLPSGIAAGISDIRKRSDWNKLAPPEFALPTETWREVISRRTRCEELRDQLAAGRIKSIDDLLIHNLDIRLFAEEAISNCEDDKLLRAFWQALTNVSILDPACGSGAFLFAALNILERLYDTCLVWMQAAIDDLSRAATKQSPEKFSDFRKILAEMNDKAQHPSPRYYILKSIMLNNLYGVDVMEEATEICKLRLFLKLVAQVNPGERIEPLPDIDFNIRAGNALVGFATEAELDRAIRSKLDFDSKMKDIKEQAEEAEQAFERFREMQVKHGMKSEDFATGKAELQERLTLLRSELNGYLAGEYGIKATDRTGYAAWHRSHHPFHWFVEFYGIMSKSGFDAVIGNPPWKEYTAVQKSYSLRNYLVESCGNIYAMFIERALRLRSHDGCVSFIVQLPLTNSSRMSTIREQLRTHSGLLCTASFDDRPGKLFEGLQNCRSVIFVSAARNAAPQRLFVTRYYRWPTEFRPYIFSLIEYVLGDEAIRPGLFPKFGATIEQEIFQKVAHSGGSTVGLFLRKERTSHFIFYQEATRYWVKATVGLPYYSFNGKVGAPAHGRYLYFSDADSAYATSAVLNSSLFYNYFIAFGDCFHLSDSLVSAFPVPRAALSDESLSRLGRELMADLNSNSERKGIKTKKSGDEIRYAEFYGWKSKPLIDEIDGVLAKHLLLNDEELDYILNFDTKFRMGADAEEAERVLVPAN